MFANSVDIVQLQRWNHAVGVPDHLFMLGKVALQSTCGMLNFMPLGRPLGGTSFWQEPPPHHAPVFLRRGGGASE